MHLADRLMELQLDPLAARLLERRIRALGIDGAVRAPHGGRAPTTASRWPTARCCPPTWSSSPPASGPRSRSRATPGSRSAAASWSTTTCATCAPGVWAVGECAEHRGTVYGLWAPVLEQARAAGAAIAGRPTAFHGAVPATTLKVAGIDLFCAGAAAEPDPLAEEVIALDSRRERYRKLVLARRARWPARRCSATLGDARRAARADRQRRSRPGGRCSSSARPRTSDAPATTSSAPARSSRAARSSPRSRERALTTVDAGVRAHRGGHRLWRLPPRRGGAARGRGLTRRRRTPGACPRTR